MLQPRGELRLVDQHLRKRGRLAVAREDLLERNELLEARIALHLRQEDLGHAAVADAVVDHVRSEPLGAVWP